MDTETEGIQVQLPRLNAEVAARTHTGRIRRHNEDAFLVDLDVSLVAVADGMGGHEHGDVASRTALTTLVKCLRRTPKVLAEAPMLEALRTANQKIYTLNEQRGRRDGTGMGSTVAGLWFDTGKAIRFNVGDSRVYLFRRGGLSQLSHDHSLYQAWLDAGAEGFAPASNILTQSLGCFAEVEPEVGCLECLPGDLFLLCSDGLTRYWTQARLEAFFSSSGADHLVSQLDKLIETANERDGSDNITAILIKIGVGK